MQATFRPIAGDWPAHVTGPNRRSAPFRASYPQTLRLLDRELAALDAREIVIQVDVRENELRIDGMPRADARPASPRVIVRAKTRYGDLSWPCAEFGDYRDNIRAIALTLERLRMAGLYGVTSRGEQYTGWKALPAPGMTTPAMTVEQAARFICEEQARFIIENVEIFRSWYRIAAKKMHPDAGGKTGEFQTLQEAKRILDAHHQQGVTA